MVFRILMFAVTLAALPLVSHATVLNFSFGGTVESVNDGANANLPGGLGPYSVGTTLSGSFTLDTALLTGGAGTSASYAGAVDNLSVMIAGNTYTNTGAGTATVNNDDMAGSSAPLRDMFLASFSVTGPSAGGAPVSGFQFSLGGTDAFAAGSLSDVDAPTVAEFQSLFANDNNDGNTKFLTFFDSVNGGFSDVRFDVDTLDVAPVPLPASAFLLLLGVGGLGVMRRKQR